MALTQDEYIERTIAQAGLTLDDMKAVGMELAPCDCDKADCPGWQWVQSEEVSTDDGGQTAQA